MRRRAHPFISGIGCGAALLLALALAVIVATRGGVPFSPGPLSAAERGISGVGGATSEFQSHAQFEAQCTQCHAPWRGVTAARCEACHVDVAAQRRGGSGLHGLLGDTSRCQECHGEHEGRTASLTRVSSSIFNHELTGFSLARHEQGFDDAPLACGDCHRQGDYTAASVDCVACHEEPAVHAGLFGVQCADCHGALAWMPAQLPDHVFPLDHEAGEREQRLIACVVCHEQTFTEYTCYNCHEHEAREIREEHVDEGIREFEDCVACHPTGTEDEAEDLLGW